MKNVVERVSELSDFKIFWKGMPPEPPSKILPRLWQMSGCGPDVRGPIKYSYLFAKTFRISG